ncbi:MAG TPA: hypothetical protein VNX68_03180, partial [Nitrosopumilaceae archaeon]|nr:hypothetical protein [Nitrosopumilaceae archaeon]
MKIKLPVTLAIIALGMQLKAQTIAAVRGMAVGSTVTVKGIVLNGSELGNIRYVQDATAGISLYGSNLSAVKRGDSIVATGTLTNYNNLLEVTPITTFNVPVSGRPLPTPVVLTPTQMSNTNQAEMMRMNGATFTLGGGTFSGNTNYTVTASGQTGQVRINTASSLVGQVIPTGA